MKSNNGSSEKSNHPETNSLSLRYNPYPFSHVSDLIKLAYTKPERKPSGVLQPDVNVSPSTSVKPVARLVTRAGNSTASSTGTLMSSFTGHFVMKNA